MVLDYFQKQKKLIYQKLVVLLKQCKQDLDLTAFSQEAITKIEKSCAEGKFIRGGLLLKSVEMFGGEINQSVLHLAAVLEILHNSLLIHDDIMDNDYLRRGQPSVFSQYIPIAQFKTNLQKDRWARAVGIGVGDMGFFLAFWLAGQEKNIYNLFSRELIRVNDGQLTDLLWSGTTTNPTLAEREKMYLAKTAYYTFYLPLQLGAILTNQPITISKKLEQLSHKLGLIFQLRDDELEFFHETNGSDIRENKQTLLKFWLYQAANLEQTNFLNSCFGNQRLTKKQLEKLRQIAKILKIDILLEQKKAELTKQALAIIKQLGLKPEDQLFLSELTDYLTKRDK